MRPYLALIKDSFRAAIASNVLYVLLAVITLLLLALAPLHVREVLDWQLKFGDNVPKPDLLAQRLVERGEDPKHPAVNRVWELLDNELQDDLTTMVEYQEDTSKMPDSGQRTMHELNARKELQKQLNEIIKRRDFYKEEAWASKRFNSELKGLMESDLENLSDERAKRLNRLLMASAFGGVVRRGSGNALEFWYGPWRWEDWTVNASYQDFSTGVLSTVTWFFDKFVMSIGLFIAIMVTANIIPETFLPGSLNLLLSKPVSRWGLLIAKFVGGCAFVSLCTVYLFVGLWIWLGLAMGIWDKGILWGIPLYIVVFAIYYSVSTLVGVVSRSAILSIIVTAIFWAACFVIGVSHQMIESRIDNSRTRGLVSAGSNLMQVGELGTISQWNENEKAWNDKLEIKMQDEQRIAMRFALFAPGISDDRDLAALGPIVDQKNNEVLVGMVDLTDTSTIHRPNLFISAADEIEFKEVGRMPQDTQTIVAGPEGTIVILGNGEFMRYIQPEPTADYEDSEKDTKSGDLTSAVGNLADSLLKKTKTKGAEKLFEDVGPDGKKVRVSNRNEVTLNYSNQDIFVYDDAEVSRFEVNDEGRYEHRIDKTVDTGARPEMRAIINAAGDSLVISLGNGEIFQLDAETLEKKNSWLPQTASPITKVDSSSDGKYFTFYCRNKTVWLLDTTKPNQVEKASLSGQGSITSISFDQDDKLWYSVANNKALQVDLSNSDRLKSVSPRTGTLAKVFTFVFDPFYTVCPKPGEFYKLVTHMSATPDGYKKDLDLRSVSDATDPWQPLWSGLLFMCAMLAIASLIFVFRDF